MCMLTLTLPCGCYFPVRSGRTSHASCNSNYIIIFYLKIFIFGFEEVAFAKQLVPLKMVASYCADVTVGTVSTELVSEHGKLIPSSMSAAPR
jgi:hypothetical protein